MYERKIVFDEQGQKIFKYLLRTSNATKVFLHKLFRKNKIYVNHKVAKKDYVIKKDDVIFCNEIEEKKDPNPIDKPLEIIYHDKNLIVIDKDSQKAIYGEKDSVVNRLKGYLKKNNNFIVPVHRLDRHTTGVLIFALNYKTARILTKMFRRQKVNKIYQTVLQGKILNNLFIEAIIKRDKNISWAENVKIHNTIPDKSKWLKANPKKSATIIKPLRVMGNFTHSEVEIWTGHHHQIRAICGSINHPVINDTKYGGKRIGFLEHYILNCKRIEIPLLKIKFESKKGKLIEELIEKL
ncbi:MAG: pseudouridine synthase [Brevinematia bacterium]